MLTAMSPVMIYGLLPVFMVSILGISIALIGIIEGIAVWLTMLGAALWGAAGRRDFRFPSKPS